MQIKQNEEYATVILPEYVKLTNAEEFKQALSSLMDQGYKTVMVDCSNLMMISSTGIGSLVLYQHKLQRQGGELKIINVRSSTIKNIFDMIELHKLISIQVVE